MAELSRDVLSKNIAAIAEMERQALHQRTTVDKIGDAITHATGSMTFAVAHVMWFGAWILINVGAIPGIEPFDRFPFGLLTLVVSLEAILLTVFVLMSQSRMTRLSEKRAHLDLQLDLLEEQELTAILRMVQALCKKHGVDVVARDLEIEQLVKHTDVKHLAVALEERLPDP